MVLQTHSRSMCQICLRSCCSYFEQHSTLPFNECSLTPPPPPAALALQSGCKASLVQAEAHDIGILDVPVNNVQAMQMHEALLKLSP